MWEPRSLTNLWTSTACYWDSFTFFFPKKTEAAGSSGTELHGAVTQKTLNILCLPILRSDKMKFVNKILILTTNKDDVSLSYVGNIVLLLKQLHAQQIMMLTTSVLKFFIESWRII
jgi:hypothetical protein